MYVLCECAHVPARGKVEQNSESRLVVQRESKERLKEKGTLMEAAEVGSGADDGE